MYKSLIDSLHLTGLLTSADQLKDILWLAAHLQDTTVQEVSTSDDEEEVDDGDLEEQSVLPSQPDVDTVIPRSDDRRAEVQLPPKELASDVVSLFASSSQGILRGQTLHVPGVMGIDGPEEMRRALMPFSKRSISWGRKSLDEEATATNAVDSGVWFPIYRPNRERTFELILIIESCPTAELRQHTLSNLAKVFLHYSGLRKVTCLRLAGGQGELILTNLDGTQEHHLSPGNSRAQRTIVVLATDAASDRWRDGSAQEFVYRIGQKMSLSIMHLMSRNAWHYTATGHPDLILKSSNPGEPSTNFFTKDAWWSYPVTAIKGIALPIFGLDADSVGAWADGISARNGAVMSGCFIPFLDADFQDAENIESDQDVKKSGVERVTRFRSMASDDAYELAVFLSRIDPLTIPIMQLIQRTMLPDTDAGVLSELLLGGVLQQSIAQDGREDQYHFHDDVANELRKELKHGEQEFVENQLRQVGRALEASQNSGAASFMGFYSPLGKSPLGLWALPFAEVSQSLLQERQYEDRAEVGRTRDERTRASVIENASPISSDAIFFVGRDKDLERLEILLFAGTFDTSNAPRVLLSGDPGVGKTALVQNFLRLHFQPLTDTRHYVQISADSNSVLSSILRERRLSLPDDGEDSDEKIIVQMQARRTLVVVDDVNRDATLDECVVVAERLSSCPMLIIRQDIAKSKRAPGGWLHMPLEPLTKEERLDFLRRSLIGFDDVKQSILLSVGNALFGNPYLLVLAAQMLCQPNTRSHLLYWLGLSSNTPTAVETMDSITSIFDRMVSIGAKRYEDICTRWGEEHSGIPIQELIEGLAMLAHGPKCEMTYSLAASIADVTGSAKKVAPFSPEQNLLQALEHLELIQEQGDTLRLVPLRAAWLRFLHPDRAEMAMANWTERIRVLLRGGRKDGWDTLDEEKPALIEWMQRSEPSSAARILTNFIDYASERGPQLDWLEFCRRMADLNSGLEQAQWRIYCVRLSFEQGLREQNANDLEKASELAKQSGSADAKRILMDIEKWKRSLEHSLQVSSIERSLGEAAILQNFQYELAERALHATINSDQRHRIGLVIQPIGTGVTGTLQQYIRNCRDSGDLFRHTFIIVANSVAMAHQTFDVFSRGKDFRVSEVVFARSEREFLEERDKNAKIIIVTGRQFDRIARRLPQSCLIIGLNIHHRALTVLQPIGQVKRIAFGDERLLLGRSATEAFGPLIAVYTRRQAIQDGYLSPVSVRSYGRSHFERKNLRKLRPTESQQLQSLFINILQDEVQAKASRGASVIVIVPDMQSAVDILTRTEPYIENDDVRLTMLQSGAKRVEQLATFARRSSDVLLLTAMQVASLNLTGIDFCYLMAILSPSSLLRIESFVNRPREGKEPGTIIDCIGNDLAILEEDHV